MLIKVQVLYRFFAVKQKKRIAIPALQYIQQRLNKDLCESDFFYVNVSNALLILVLICYSLMKGISVCVKTSTANHKCSRHEDCDYVIKQGSSTLLNNFGECHYSVGEHQRYCNMTTNNDAQEKDIDIQNVIDFKSN